MNRYDYTIEFLNEKGKGRRDAFIDIASRAKQRIMILNGTIIMVSIGNRHPTDPIFNHNCLGLCGFMREGLYSIELFNDPNIKRLIETYLHELRHVWHFFTEKETAAELAAFGIQKGRFLSCEGDPREIDADAYANREIKRYQLDIDLLNAKLGANKESFNANCD